MTTSSMSAFGTKRTSRHVLPMSAFGGKATSGGGRFSFICALSASRGHADERAIHLLRNALHGAYAEFAGDFDDAVPARKQSWMLRVSKSSPDVRRSSWR